MELSMSSSELFDAVHATALFKGMSETEIKHGLYCLNTTVRNFRKGEIIYLAGDKTDKIGLVLSGSIIVEMTDAAGSRALLSRFGKGSFFGEAFAFSEDAVIPVDILANENTQVVFFAVGRLMNHSCEAPSILMHLNRNLLQIAIKKNRELTSRSFHTAPHTIRGKVLAYLQTRAYETKTRDFDIPYSRQQLADYLGIDRSALSKELSHMKEDGLLDYWRNHFRLLVSS